MFPKLDYQVVSMPAVPAQLLSPARGNNYQQHREWGIVPSRTRSCSTPILRFLLSDFAAASVNTLGLSRHIYRLFRRWLESVQKRAQTEYSWGTKIQNSVEKKPSLTHVASHFLTFVMFFVLCSLGTSRILWYVFTTDMNSAKLWTVVQALLEMRTVE